MSSRERWTRKLGMNLASREQRGEATTHHHTTEKTVEENKLARLTKAQLTALLKEQTERLEGINTKHLLAAGRVPLGGVNPEARLP